MNIAKTVKKIAALAAGATMLGATIMGATALDLSNYPAPFVTNGVWDGKIVVGAKAATSDVVGAIDLAAALQADAKTVSTVNVPGAAGTATVVGDSAEFKAGSDILGIGEALNDVKTTFGASDLDALQSGVLDTGLGTTQVRQYLKFENNNASVTYRNNDDDVLGDYLYIPDETELYEYHMEFTESAISEIDGTDLPDLEGEVLNFLGAPYTIVDATYDGTSEVTLKLMGGQVADVLRDGETKTYDVNGKKYEVTAVFIDSNGYAKLSVNGVMTKSLSEGASQVLGGDVAIGVKDIMTNQREGLVEFYIGANKLELKDPDVANDYEGDGVIKIGTKSLTGVDVAIKAVKSGDELKINYIKFKAEADDEYFIPAGKGLKEFLSDPLLVLDTWDIVYTGLMKTGSTDIKLTPVSEHSYKLTFTNVVGDTYSFPYLSTRNIELKWGSDKNKLFFTEDTNTTAYPIAKKDYFVVADKTSSGDVDDAITRVMRYVSIQTTDKVVTFEDLAGNSWGVSYTGTEGTNAVGDLIVDGKTHKFYVGGEAADYPLRIDLDGDNGFGDEVYLVTKGGGIIDLGSQTFTDGVLDAIGDGDDVDLTLTTLADNFDEGTTNSVITINLGDATDNNKMTINSVDIDGESLLTDDSNDNYQRGMSNYGAFVNLFTPDSGAPSVTIEYPLVQRGAQVFVTAGEVEVQEGAATGGGAITTTTINPIAVGLAVLDTEAPALGTKNMIVVGGPCVNTVAAALMGNPVECTQGFTPGKAIIKWFGDKKALLVAGYSAQDTVGACKVLAQYDKYKLSGTEVEVIAADLNALSVKKVQ